MFVNHKLEVSGLQTIQAFSQNPNYVFPQVTVILLKKYLCISAL